MNWEGAVHGIGICFQRHGMCFDISFWSCLRYLDGCRSRDGI